MKARMRTTQRARQRLKGHWAESVTVECICITAGMVIPMASIAVLHLIGISPDSVVHASDIRGGGRIYALVTAGFIVFDWLLISPFLLGRLAFYQHIAAGRQAPFYIVFRFFGRRYFHALRWRISLFLHRLICLFICLTPAAIAAGLSKAIRHGGSPSSTDDVILLLCTLCGFFLFVAGIIVCEILMMRRLAAAYLLIESPDGSYPKRLFKASAAKMRGHIIETFQLVTGFGGWFAACLFIIPYFYVMPLFLTTRALAVAGFARKNSRLERSRTKKRSVDTQATVEIPLR